MTFYHVISPRPFFSKAALVAGLTFAVSGCVVVPQNDASYSANCEISSDKKTLKVMNVAKDTNTYYSISGIVLTPILYPTSAIISGAYVVVNNVYNLGEEKLVCE